jgi:hypothetical protein
VEICSFPTELPVIEKEAWGVLTAGAPERGNMNVLRTGVRGLIDGKADGY